MIGKNICIIRNDLRLHDNTALIEAIAYCANNNEKLTLIFHINTEQIKEGTNSNDYFFSALHVFYKRIKEMGSDILFLYGSPKEAFNDFVCHYQNVDRVFFNASERGYGLRRDSEISRILEERGIAVHTYLDKHLHSSHEILNGNQAHYKVFTPYYNKWISLDKGVVTPFDKVAFQQVICNDFDNKYKETFHQILNSRKTIFDDLCGEQRALDDLDRFIKEDIDDYDNARDIPSLDATSRMSRYLSSGEVSIRQIYNAVMQASDTKGKETYIKELAWRDFYNMVYTVHPTQHNEEIIEKYRTIKWNKNKYLFDIWKDGLTGYPFVDAGMRQLKETGFMHNRLRMIVASFLVKDLLIDWRLGEQYFRDMLLDYDSASNIGGWQWASSTGTDACPYFRIFNPTTQSKRFDRDGEFIQKYVEELRDVDPKYIHEPYKYKGKLDLLYYPSPIVVHKEQRVKALDMYSSFIEYDYYDVDLQSEYIKRRLLFELRQLRTSKIKDLIAFHSNNKYLYFIYNQKLKDELGNILARNINYQDTLQLYSKTLLELFYHAPTKGKCINAYEHMYGYFKKKATDEEKDAFKNLIANYEEDLASSVEINDYLMTLANKYHEEYILHQSMFTLIY